MGGNARARREFNRQDELDKSGSKQRWGGWRGGGGADGDRETDPCTVTGEAPGSPPIGETSPRYSMLTFSHTQKSLNH